MTIQLPPTPAKFHYIFNMRDLSRIYGGLCLMTVDRFSRKDQLVRLWLHEVHRVIMDRLIIDTDQQIINVSTCIIGFQVADFHINRRLLCYKRVNEIIYIFSCNAYWISLMTAYFLT